MIEKIELGGLAVVIGAIAAAVPIIGGFVLQVLDRIEKKHRDDSTTRREQKIDEIAVKVDGLTEKAIALGVRAGTAEGREKGIAEERENQQGPTVTPGD